MQNPIVQYNFTYFIFLKSYFFPFDQSKLKDFLDKSTGIIYFFVPKIFSWLFFGFLNFILSWFYSVLCFNIRQWNSNTAIPSTEGRTDEEFEYRSGIWQRVWIGNNAMFSLPPLLTQLSDVVQIRGATFLCVVPGPTRTNTVRERTRGEGNVIKSFFQRFFRGKIEHSSFLKFFVQFYSFFPATLSFPWIHALIETRKKAAVKACEWRFKNSKWRLDRDTGL